MVHEDLKRANLFWPTISPAKPKNVVKPERRKVACIWYAVIETIRTTMCGYVSTKNVHRSPKLIGDDEDYEQYSKPAKYKSMNNLNIPVATPNKDLFFFSAWTFKDVIL